MKILYVVHDMFVGGVSTVVNNLMKGMKEEDHEIYIVILKSSEIDIECDQQNIYILNIKGKFNYISGCISLKNIISSINPDIIHSHTILSHLMVLFLKKFSFYSSKVICTEHSTLNEDQANSLPFLIFKKLKKEADLITFVSGFSLESYKNLNIITNEKSKVIYNGVNNKDINLNNVLKIKDEISYNPKYKYFCFIGRISPEKNLELMLNVFKCLSDECKLIIVGTGDTKYVEKIKNMSVSLNLQNIIFLGYREDIVEILNVIDCVLLTSVTEGLPTVVIESYSQRKIAISTICGGIQEIIRDPVFLAPSNDKKLIKKRIDFFLNLSSDETNFYLEKNYNLFLTEFHIKIMVRNFFETYQEVLSV